MDCLIWVGGMVLDLLASVRDVGLRRFDDGFLLSTAKPQSKKCGGKKRRMKVVLRARVARNNKLCLLKKIYQ